MQIIVIGSGGWGTALALLLLRNGHAVTLWSHCAEESENLAKTLENPYLPGVPLPMELHFTSDPADARGKEMAVFATPSFAVRTTAKRFAPYLPEETVLVSVTKGIEEGTGCRRRAGKSSPSPGRPMPRRSVVRSRRASSRPARIGTLPSACRRPLCATAFACIPLLIPLVWSWERPLRTLLRFVRAFATAWATAIIPRRF